MPLITEPEKKLAEAMSEGLLVVAHDHRIQWANRAATELLQQPVATLQGSRLFEVIPDQRLEDFVLSDEGTESLIINPKDNHSIRWVLRQVPYTAELTLCFIQDITHTAILEAVRQDFIANLSHELRTPLTVFRGYLELLKQEQDIDPVQLQGIFIQLFEQVQRMERLVEGLLLLSRLESDEPDFSTHKPVAIGSLLKLIVESASGLSSGQHQISLHCDADLTLTGQEDELHSAFSNLIYNAVRYTPAGGQIQVRCYQQDQSLILQVEDNGIGMADKHLSRITQRFYQVDKSRSYKGIGGTGLGLAIAKHVLLRHNAELKIQSELGCGSSFYCVFPR